MHKRLLVGYCQRKHIKMNSRKNVNLTAIETVRIKLFSKFAESTEFLRNQEYKRAQPDAF